LLRLGFWWRRRPASEPVRELVRMHCAHIWREYAAVLYLGPQVVSYQVPGRRPDGTPRRRQVLSWAGRLVLRAVALVPGLVVLPLLLVAELFDSGDGDSWVLGTPELTITGLPGTIAVDLGDCVRGHRGELWLAWSGTRIGVLSDEPRVLWQAETGPAHDLAPAAGAVDFADGSSLGFVPSLAELTRLRETAGRP
jgi:hypothetical protein